VLWLTSSLLLLDLVFYLLHGALPNWDGLEGHLHCFALQSSPMFLHPFSLIVIELLILSLGKETTHTWMLLESILVVNSPLFSHAIIVFRLFIIGSSMSTRDKTNSHI